MKKIKIIFSFCILLIIMTIIFFKKNNEEIILKDIKLENITFLDIFNDKILYSQDNKTISYKNNKKEELDINIIKKIRNYYVYKNENNKVGLLDENLNEILEASYDDINNSNLKDTILLKKNNKMFIYNIRNKHLGIEYDYIYPANKMGLFKVRKSEKYGYIDENSNEIIPIDYTSLFDFKGEKCIAQKKEGWGIIDKKNTQLTNFTNKEIYIHENGNWILKTKDDKYIDSEGHEIKDIRLFPTLSNYIVYEKNDKFGVFNLEALKKIDKLYSEIGIYISKGMIVSNGIKYDVIKPLGIDEPNYKYDYITQIDENIYGIGNNESGKLKFLSTENFFKSDKEFENIQKLSYNLYGCTDEEDIFFYTKTGELKLVEKIKNIVFFNDRYIVYKFKDKYKVFKL